MPQTINPYFDINFNQSEQSLVADLIEEAIQITGIEMLYCPRKYFALDRFYGEDVLSAFEKAYPVEMYLKSTDYYDGDGDFLSKFGLEIRNEASFNVSIRRFNQLVVGPHLDATGQDIKRPKEGDLIYFPIDRKLFEISFVEEKSVFFQLGNLYMYLIKCRSYDASSERLDTGVQQIDRFEDEYGYEVAFQLDSGFGEYEVGEVVVSSVNADFTAKVSNWNSTAKVLQLTRTKSDIPLTGTLAGQSSGATYTFIADDEVEGANNPLVNSNERIIDNDDDRIDSVVNVSSNPLLG